jgi:hypothetical protein
MESQSITRFIYSHILEVSEIQKCISNMKIACEKQINMQVVDVKMSILHWLTF